VEAGRSFFEPKEGIPAYLAKQGEFKYFLKD